MCLGKAMREDERIWIVRDLLTEYVKSPSLKHIRDGYALGKLAADIVKKLDRRAALWQKWEGQREVLLKSAALCWIPTEDLRTALNAMPGPALTTTDVVQRLHALYAEPYEHYPDEELQAGCLAIFEAEKAQGTELSAIVGALQEHVEQERERLRAEREAAWRKQAEEERVALEQRFLSGADCKWTPVKKSKQLYSRINGRSYRLTPTADKKWHLHRITSIDDANPMLIGKYGRRGDITKVLAKLAYEPEPRW